MLATRPRVLLKDDHSRGGRAATHFLSPWFLVAITLLAFALRLFHLGAQSLWYDEGFLVEAARKGWLELLGTMATDNSPPLHPALLHLWMGGAGKSELAVRTLSLLFGVLTVPLLARLGRQLRLRATGLLAAFLLAISPYHIWYSQETRMYALAAFFTLLSLSCFLALLHRPGRGIWLAYLASALAALYSYYYDVFFILLHTLLFFEWKKNHPQQQQSRRSSISWRSWVIGQSLLGILFFPWALVALNRLQLDRSYWPGTLAPEVLLGRTIVAFGAGRSLPLLAGQPIGIAFLLAALLGCGFLACAAVSHRASRIGVAGVLLSIFAPLLVVTAISYTKPKYSPSYLIMALPLYDFLVAAAITVPLGWLALPLRRRGIILQQILAGVLVSGVLISTTAASAVALQHSAADPAYARDDFRSLVAALEQRVAPDDAILLDSGHFYPVFLYYYHGAVPWYPLPSAREDFRSNVDEGEMAARLTALSRGRRHLWLVTWQNLNADPSNTIIHLLDENTRQVAHYSWRDLGLTEYAIPRGTTFPAAPVISNPLALNFGAAMRLLGYRLDAAPRSGEPVLLTLFWTALRPIPDYTAHLRLLDSERREWATAQHFAGNNYYRPDRWVPGKIVRDSFALDLPPASPPGAYRLALSIFPGDQWQQLLSAQADGKPLGQEPVLGSIELARASTPPSLAALAIAHRRNLSLNGLSLLGYSGAGDNGSTLSPGQALTLDLFWQVHQADPAAKQPPIEQSTALFSISDPQGKIWQQVGTPVSSIVMSSRWRDGDIFRARYSLIVPGIPGNKGVVSIAVLPGVVMLVQEQLPLASLAAIKPLPTGSVPLFSFVLSGIEHAHSFTIPHPQHPLAATFGEGIRLLGYDLSSNRAHPGDTVQVRIYWQAKQAVPANYTVFLHLLDSTNLQVAGADSPPLDGAYPTAAWLPNEVVLDTHTLHLPVGLAPARYTLQLGLYAPATLKRLPVSLPGQAGGASQNSADTLNLGYLNVKPLRQPALSEIVGPDLQHTRANDFGHQIHLLGYRLTPTQPSAGQTLQVRLFWQASTAVTADYTVFVHLLDTSGHIVAQVDSQPQAGRSPTSSWDPEEYIDDTQTISLPATLPPGPYHLELGLYLPGTNARLPVYRSDGQQVGDTLILGEN